MVFVEDPEKRIAPKYKPPDLEQPPTEGHRVSLSSPHPKLRVVTTETRRSGTAPARSRALCDRVGDLGKRDAGAAGRPPNSARGAVDPKAKTLI